MIKVTLVADLVHVKQFLLYDYKLAHSSLTDEELIAYDLGRWKPDPLSGWLCIEDDRDILGYIKFEQLTNILFSCHIYTQSKYWGTDVADKMTEAGEEWFRTNTSCCQILIQCPRSCAHPIKCSVRQGYELTAVLPNAIVWRQKLEHLVLLMKDIRS